MSCRRERIIFRDKWFFLQSISPPTFLFPTLYLSIPLSPIRKICKNCGCPRGAHKIQRVIEEKKEVPRSILLSTADEDEDDYKELEVSILSIFRDICTQTFNTSCYVVLEVCVKRTIIVPRHTQDLEGAVQEWNLHEGRPNFSQPYPDCGIITTDPVLYRFSYFCSSTISTGNILKTI